MWSFFALKKRGEIMPKSKTSLNELLYDIRRIAEHREVLTEEKIRAIYKSLVKDLNAYIAEYYVQYADEEGILTISKLQEKMKYAKFLEEIEKNVNIFAPLVAKEIIELVENTYKISYEGMETAVNASYKLEELNVRPEVMKRAVANNIEKLTALPALLERNRAEIIYEMKQIINIGLLNGERYETMAKKIIEKVDISYGRATNIVRTETHRNIEAGFNDCAQDIVKGLEGSDLVYVKIWRTMKDDRVRPQKVYKTKKGWKKTISRNGADHVKMEGVTVEATDTFKLEYNVYATCPGMSGTARNDCRCRCFLEYDLLTKEEWKKLGKRQVNKEKSK